MVRVEEANLSQAMEFTFKRLIEPKDPDGILDYRPVNQKDKTWLTDNPSTGIIYLKKHPNAKEAWVLVKFERSEPEYGTTVVPQQRKTLRTPQEFETFFGVAPSQGWNKDTVVQVSWDKQEQVNKRTSTNFDETAPNFYMYTNHLQINLDKVIKRLYRINEIIETTGTVGSLFKIPYSATNV